VNKYGPTRSAVEFQTAVQDEESDFSEIQISIL